MAKDDSNKDESLDTQNRDMDLPEREDTNMQDGDDGEQED
jgi:hypothetical protein